MDRVRLVDWLRLERDQRVDHGLYYNTQVMFAWNSNHMEGSTLSAEQTAQLFDTGAVLPSSTDDEIRADDVAETTNHFRVFDWMLDHVDDPVDDALLFTLHGLLKRGTSQERDPDRNVGGYKLLPNVISQLEGIHTVLPNDVPTAMREVLGLYADLRDDPFEIARAHWMFETTHPFSDGNGRVGRLVMFKELLRLDSIPVLLRDEHHNLYTRGLRRFPEEPVFLVDLLLSERDAYRALVEELAPGRIRYSYADQWDATAVAERIAAHPTVNVHLKRFWDDREITSHLIRPSEDVPPSDHMRGDGPAPRAVTDGSGIHGPGAWSVPIQGIEPPDAPGPSMGI
ncbi:Fic family protein [Bifidobacterium psychraerophilum]|uniref:Fic family protein n=1 Tax=Bifidobacterium psychraerophilum TaxID=218140 RepID=A0A087CG87_9BIFI|nr:Fic family protein [Bifidobacterium psychraerophilum]KFI82287.1 Fic family protein [Bifidobacterium psychraerophilum]PKA95089.1 Fic/DOC family protein [Bifidobacterium psychraerophilum DSM 22366]